MARLRTASAPGGRPPAAEIEEFLAEVSPSSVLDFQLRLRGGTEVSYREYAGRVVTRFTPVESAVTTISDQGYDAVVCSGALEYLPNEDIPWLIEALFRRARWCVVLSVNTNPEPIPLAGGAKLRVQPRSASWWLAQMDAAGGRYPDVRWKLVARDDGRARRPLLVREGGRRANVDLPTVWVLKDHKAGHTTQSVGLAEAIGFPYEIKDLRFNLLNHLSNRMRGASRLGLNRSRSAPLAPPWPDLVISTGRRTAPVARWIGRKSRGRTRLVQLGRRGGEVVDAFDLVVACAHFRLALHPRRMEIIAPLNVVTPARLARAAERWRGLFEGAARPHIVLVVGGTSARHRLGAKTARRMGAEVQAFAESLGGTVFAITSPRTGAKATAALRVGLGESGHLHEWRPGENDNPYVGYLALADAIVVTGESESMLAEAAAAGKPLFIYPLPERPLGFRRAAEWVAERAEARPRKAKGTVRPQQGLEYLCARLIADGIIRPPRHLDRLHQGLIRNGVARFFGTSFDPAAYRPLRDIDEVASRVRGLLGFTGPTTAERTADDRLPRRVVDPAAAWPHRGAVSAPTVGGNGTRRPGASQP